ncbi:MAG: radical SAM protein, partial [Bacteroidales bacterium]|nr:radical SAM protein [Bacteroidales bacterium]
AKEARNLVKNGTKELILIAQDLTYYGIDLEKKQLLPQLLYKLNEIEGLEWIRLHYTYPASFPKDLLKAMKDCEKVCNYIDMPIQHISDSVLTGMRRAISKDETYRLLNEFRSEIPNITLRTTLMTGFPGEGENEFKELVEFVKEMKFDRLGVFTYSEEEDTYAQKQFTDDIPQEVKEERADIIMQIQQDISLELNQQKIGNSYKTIIDRKEGDFYIGRTEADSPEVDNEILITTNKDLTIGEFYNVKIESSDDFDLYGVV